MCACAFLYCLLDIRCACGVLRVEINISEKLVFSACERRAGKKTFGEKNETKQKSQEIAIRIFHANNNRNLSFSVRIDTQRAYLQLCVSDVYLQSAIECDSIESHLCIENNGDNRIEKVCFALLLDTCEASVAKKSKSTHIHDSNSDLQQ